MSALVDRLVAHVLSLEVRLLACQARLSARTDPEALHDLRTTVRRLRSLVSSNSKTRRLLSAS
jgi:CHAD domain-containing protein